MAAIRAVVIKGSGKVSGSFYAQARKNATPELGIDDRESVIDVRESALPPET
jgi:hypothetical protein